MTPSKAVKELRKALNISQQTLAVRARLAVSSVSHFEQGQRNPDPTSALEFYRIACEAERDDLAEIFLEVIHDAMGHLIAPVRDEVEHRKIRALQFILYDQRYEKLREPLNEMLAPVEKHLQRLDKRKAEADKGLAEGVAALAEMKKKGGKR